MLILGRSSAPFLDFLISSWKIHRILFLHPFKIFWFLNKMYMYFQCAPWWWPMLILESTKMNNQDGGRTKGGNNSSIDGWVSFLRFEWWGLPSPLLFPCRDHFKFEFLCSASTWKARRQLGSGTTEGEKLWLIVSFVGGNNSSIDGWVSFLRFECKSRPPLLRYPSILRVLATPRNQN